MRAKPTTEQVVLDAIKSGKDNTPNPPIKLLDNIPEVQEEITPPQIQQTPEEKRRALIQSDIAAQKKAEIPVPKEPGPQKATILEGKKMDTTPTEKDVKRTLDIGIVGVGGGGCKLADAFASVGYDVAVVNLTDRDYAHLTHIPKDDNSRLELVMTAGGAGKNPDVGVRAIDEFTNFLTKKFQRKFNNKEFVFVCAGLGGGTGTLGGVKVARIIASLGIPTGMIVTLPRNNEGTDEKANCLRGLKEIANDRAIKSIVVIDNQRVAERLKNTPDTAFWTAANMEIVRLFDSFNTYSSQTSDTAFDAEDYRKMLSTNGFINIGETTVPGVTVNADGSVAYGESLDKIIAAVTNGFLATGFDLSSAVRAAGLIIKPDGEYSHAFEEALFNHLKTVIGAGGLNRGIYQGTGKALVVKTMLAGLRIPQSRVDELVNITLQESNAMKQKVQQRATEVIDIGIPADIGQISGIDVEEQGRKR